MSKRCIKFYNEIKSQDFDFLVGAIKKARSFDIDGGKFNKKNSYQEVK